MIKRILKSKINRFLSSKKIFRLIKFFYTHFNKNDIKIGSIGFDYKGKPHRSDVVQEFINLSNYKSYLEIGCYKNELFDKIACENKIGVDPFEGGNIKKTSDEFFCSNKKYFDCIFIDGLHKYNQVKKDIFNSLKFLNSNGVILLHDCLPNNFFDQAVPRCQYNWNGDVWKAIIEIRTYPNLDTYTCYADQGIGIIFKRANRNLITLNKNFKNLDFSYFFNNYKKLMNIIEFYQIKKII